jgi:hypothetical protein
MEAAHFSKTFMSTDKIVCHHNSEEYQKERFKICAIQTTDFSKCTEVIIIGIKVMTETGQVFRMSFFSLAVMQLIT